MCLVFVALQPGGRFPVLIGANREESRRRPATSPVCVRSGSARCVLAGADTGPEGTFPEIGTWLGVNESGLVVAVTNRSDGELAWEDQTRSRGLLAVALLGSDDPEQAAGLARGELASGGFGGSNFLIAGPKAAFVVHAPGATRVLVDRLTPGIHAITNLTLDDAEDPRIRLVRECLEPEEFITSARRLCRDGRIVIDGRERGTVSSSLIEVGDEIGFHHIIGDPRECDYLVFRPFLI
jgi:uncharacterized protein with NRDE domain